MTIKAVCTNPKSVEFTITATFNLAQWERIRSTLNDGEYNGAGELFANQIGDIINMFANAKYVQKEDSVQAKS